MRACKFFSIRAHVSLRRRGALSGRVKKPETTQETTHSCPEVCRPQHARAMRRRVYILPGAYLRVSRNWYCPACALRIDGTEPRRIGAIGLRHAEPSCLLRTIAEGLSQLRGLDPARRRLLRRLGVCCACARPEHRCHARRHRRREAVQLLLRVLVRHCHAAGGPLGPNASRGVWAVLYARQIRPSWPGRKQNVSVMRKPFPTVGPRGPKTQVTNLPLPPRRSLV